MGFLDLEGVAEGLRRRTPSSRTSTSSIARGEFVSFLGPSGCGKTTTLRMIAGFEVPSAGTIRIDGKDVTDLRPNQRNVGMVFQSYALFPNLTVADNVAFGLKVARPARRGDRKRASTRCWRSSSCRSSASAIRTSSPAASSSAWRSPAPSRSSRRCCSSTSRSPRSTPRSAFRSARRSARSSASSASPPSTSPTTRKKRCRCPTASW